MHRLANLVCTLALVLGAGRAPCQATRPAADADRDTRSWSFGATAYAYFVPGGPDYVQPTLEADRDWLHLEARYNYEAQETGSLWAGYSFSGGTELTWEIRPMLGAVFGKTDGIAPGYEGSLGWRGLELYSEGEHVFDTGDHTQSFFYTWSELTFAPTEWLRFGAVIQRTRAYEAGPEVQRGLLVGLTFGRLDFSAVVFDIDESSPLVAISAGISF